MTFDARRHYQHFQDYLATEGEADLRYYVELHGFGSAQDWATETADYWTPVYTNHQLEFVSEYWSDINDASIDALDLEPRDLSDLMFSSIYMFLHQAVQDWNAELISNLDKVPTAELAV